MEKIKQILHPHKKDEERYGNAEERRKSSVVEPTTSDSAPLNTTAESEKKEHGVLRQILNPGGSKYDSQAFGDNATTAVGDPENPQALVTDANAAHEHTVRDQILNPGGAKYDETRFGTTAHAAGGLDTPTTGAAPLETVPQDAILQTDPEQKKHEHSILRQILNPGGAKYDNERFGTTSHVVTGDAAAEALAESRPEEKKHEHGILRQIVNPRGEKYDSTAFAEPPTDSSTEPKTESGSLARDATVGSAVAGGAVAGGALAGHDHEDVPSKTAPVGTAAGTSTIPSSAANTDSDKFAKDAAIGTAAVGGGAFASHELANRDATVASAAPQINKPTGANDVENATYTYSTTPVGIGASTVQATPSTIDNMHAQPVSSGTSDELPSTGVRHGHAIHDAEAGAAAGVAGGAIASQINQPKADKEIAAATHVDRSYPLAGATPGVIHHTQGPHITDAANKLDPDVDGVRVPVESYAGTTSSTVAPGAATSVLGTTGAFSSSQKQEPFAGTTTSAAAPGASTSGIGSTGVPGEKTTVVPDTTTSGVKNTGASFDRGALGVATTAAAGGAAAYAIHGAGEPSTAQKQEPVAGTAPATLAAHSATTGQQNPAVGTTTNSLASPSSAAHTQSNVSNTTWQEPSGPVAHDHHMAKDASEAGLIGAGAGAVYSSELPHQSDKHERKLQEAREEEAAKGGDRGEKKEGLIHKLLHLGHKDKDHEKAVDQHQVGSTDATHTTDPAAVSAAQTAVAEHPSSATIGTSAVPALDPVADKSTAVIEPHTGLPMDPAKYGTTGAGGTDGSSQIRGYHTADPAEIAAQQAYNPTIGIAGPLDKDGQAATGPNWDAIKKANTPY